MQARRFQNLFRSRSYSTDLLWRKSLDQIADPAAEHGMDQIRCHIGERHEDEGTLMRPRMRQQGRKLGADQVADRDDVKVERPGCIGLTPDPPRFVLDCVKSG